MPPMPPKTGSCTLPFTDQIDLPVPTKPRTAAVGPVADRMKHKTLIEAEFGLHPAKPLYDRRRPLAIFVSRGTLDQIAVPVGGFD